MFDHWSRVLAEEGMIETMRWDGAVRKEDAPAILPPMKERRAWRGCEESGWCAMRKWV